MPIIKNFDRFVQPLNIEQLSENFLRFSFRCYRTRYGRV